MAVLISVLLSNLIQETRLRWVNNSF